MTEAVSFLVLLGIAMPMKYLAGQPMAVKIVGWAHGVLFIGFCVALMQARAAANWGLARTGLLFVAALVPFGPFLVDRRLRDEESESRGGAAISSHDLEQNDA